MRQIDFFEEMIIDNFAGGGGASTGIELATGRAVDVYNVLGLLLDTEDNAEIYSIIRRKKARWLNRLEG